MKRSKFSLSHYKLLTMDMGELIPITWYEALPGDSIQQASSVLIRVSPLLAPVMHPVRVRIHHWFVPYRLIWDDWEDFITGGADGNDSSTPPYMSAANISEGGLADYLGVPTGAHSPNLTFSALPFRAYTSIFNEHYRDQDLVTELTIDTTDGLDTTTNGSKQKIAWEKDYFTTARPWEQKGTEVTIPLTGDAPVQFDGTAGSTRIALLDSGSTLRDMIANPSDSDRIMAENATAAGEGMYADLSSVSGVAINDLRVALAIQRYQEARAMYGSRYVEYLRYLGVRSSDARLQNPEYLGGGRQTIQFSEVLSTNDDDTSDYAGRLRGHGISAMRTNRFRRFFEEHGIVMTLLSVVPKAIYAQGLHKHWSRSAKEEWFQKELQHLGDEEVLNKEVYAQHSSPDGVFGYQSRYDSYRSMPSNIAAEFRSTLDHWHYSRIFSGDPSLNSTFINATPTKRVNVSDSTDCLYVMANHSIQARRMLTKVAKPRTF